MATAWDLIHWAVLDVDLLTLAAIDPDRGLSQGRSRDARAAARSERVSGDRTDSVRLEDAKEETADSVRG